jgi:hypothetical protein
VKTRNPVYAVSAVPGSEPYTVKIPRIIAALDSQGRWLSTYVAGERLVGQPKFQPGEQYLSSAVFAENTMELYHFLNSAKLSGVTK